MLKKYRFSHPNGLNQEEAPTLEQAMQRRAEVAAIANVPAESIPIEPIEFLPVEAPASEPDWEELLNLLSTPENNSLMEALEASARWSQISIRLATIAANPAQWKGEQDRLLLHWNAAPPSLSAEHRQQLRQAAEVFHLPLQLTENNHLQTP